MGRKDIHDTTESKLPRPGRAASGTLGAVGLWSRAALTGSVLVWPGWRRMGESIRAADVSGVAAGPVGLAVCGLVDRQPVYRLAVGRRWRPIGPRRWQVKSRVSSNGWKMFLRKTAGKREIHAHDNTDADSGRADAVARSQPEAGSNYLIYSISIFCKISRIRFSGF